MRCSVTPERSSSFASARWTPNGLRDELGMSNATTLSQTSNYQAWIRLMHDGAPMQPRLLHMFAPPPEGPRFRRSSRSLATDT